MILEKSFVLFVVFSISHDIIKNKRTYVLKGVENLEDTQWAKAYLQQADSIRFYIKELKQQMNCSDCFGQSTVKARIDILYGMYLDCKHIGDFLHKRAQVEKVLKQERRERASVKKVTELGYHDRKHIWNATVSISKQFTNGYGISSDAESVDQSYAGRTDKKTI